MASVVLMLVEVHGHEVHGRDGEIKHPNALVFLVLEANIRHRTSIDASFDVLVEGIGPSADSSTSPMGRPQLIVGAADLCSLDSTFRPAGLQGWSVSFVL